MLTHEFVPKLVLAEPGEFERFLPEAAEGAVEVWPGNSGFEAYGYAAGGYYWAHFPGAASYRFLAEQGNVVALADPEVPPHVIEDTYLRGVMPLVLQLRGHEVLHASAVSTPGGLVVFCGVSGAGKSTFVSALSSRGYQVWADDAVALDLDGKDAVALQVPFRIALRPDAAELLSFTGGADSADEAPSRSPIRALLILEPLVELNASLVDIRRLAPTAAFTTLLPHAYYFRLSDPRRKALMLDRYLKLASSVSTFDARYRPGLGHISFVLDEIEEHVGGAR